MPFLLEPQQEQSFCPFSRGITSPPAQGQCPVTGAKTISVSEPKASTTASFEKLYPIMARLPEEEDRDTWNDKASRFEEDYFTTNPDVLVPGTLEYEPQHANVRYTQSRLPEIDTASRDLWAALHKLHPLTASYAGNFQCSAISSKRRRSSVSKSNSCPMQNSASSSLDLIRRVFNWNQLTLPESTEGSFYGVIFRSKRNLGSEDLTQALYAADKLSHEEAVAAGGLLMYWYGVPDKTTGSNLATCIWRTREEARKASALPLHKQAAKHALKAYEDFELSRYRVVKRTGETGVHIEEWDA